ncbi:MAG: hypothetical protein V9E94_12950 [Microthrixaceae bacterium]
MPSDAHDVSRGDVTEPWRLEDVRIDDRPEPPRTRRTSDLLRLVLTVAAMALVVFAGSIGSGTTEGIQEDITSAVTNVPALVVSLLATLNNLIVLALPVYLVAELAIRRKWRVLLVALMASSLALVAANLFSKYADQLIDGVLLDALTLPVGGGSSRTAAAFGVFAGVAALMSAEGQAARSRTLAVVWTALLALGALFLIDRRATPLALMLSLLGGLAFGLLARYVAGTENPRVPTRGVIAALGACRGQTDLGAPVARRVRPGTSVRARDDRRPLRRGPGVRPRQAHGSGVGAADPPGTCTHLGDACTGLVGARAGATGRCPGADGTCQGHPHPRPARRGRGGRAHHGGGRGAPT